jgi:hypothetical protein
MNDRIPKCRIALRSRRAALAMGLGLAIGLVPVTSAGALGSTGDNTSSGGSASIPPASSTASGLSLTVTTSSVVATAVVHYTGAAPDVTVAWGDGASTRTSPPTASVPGRPVPTQGQVVFQHAYVPLAAPFFREHIGVLDSISHHEIVGQDVVIVARYRVTQHTLEFAPLNNCDSFAELFTEWLIRRLGGGLPFKVWQFSRRYDVNFPNFQPIAGSDVSVETTIGSAPKIPYDGIEEDPIDDETFDQQVVDMQPALGSRTVTLTYSERNGFDCKFMLRTSIDVVLLTPGYNGGPIVSP